MTMPGERARAIRWGCEVLIKIQEDPLVSDEVKREAADILVRYPSEALLKSWIDGSELSELSMTAQGRDALLRARQLFEQIRMAEELNGTTELRRSLVFTLRHFPMMYELRQRNLIVLRPWVSRRETLRTS